MAKLVSKVYGDALFSLAVEENRVDELWDETRAMKQVLSENPDFMAILEHPEIFISFPHFLRLCAIKLIIQICGIRNEYHCQHSEYIRLQCAGKYIQISV